MLDQKQNIKNNLTKTAKTVGKPSSETNKQQGERLIGFLKPKYF